MLIVFTPDVDTVNYSVRSPVHILIGTSPNPPAATSYLTCRHGTLRLIRRKTSLKHSPFGSEDLLEKTLRGLASA
jgi:hypothetical protein